MNLNFTQPKKEVFHFLNLTDVDAVMGMNEKFIVLFTEGEYNVKIPETTPNDQILTKLCKLTQSKMYGDYLVCTPNFAILFDDFCPDSICPVSIGYYVNGKLKVGHIFAEYSRFLRGKENYWEEVWEKVKKIYL